MVSYYNGKLQNSPQTAGGVKPSKRNEVRTVKKRVFRRVGLCAMLLCLSLSLCGCMFEQSEGMYALPILPEAYSQLQSTIQDVMDQQGAEYATISSGSNTSTVQLLDLNRDGEQEMAAVFLRVTSAEEKPLRVCLFRKGADNKIVLIGDKAQLPPVGLDDSPALSEDWLSLLGDYDLAELTTVVRQQTDSGILKNATLIRRMIQEAWGAGLDDLSLKLDVDGCPDIRRICGSDLIEKLTDAYDKFGDDETVVICRSNRRAIKYNLGIRSAVQFKEEMLVRGDRLMIVRNCYKFADGLENVDYIANGDIATLEKISDYEDRYGLHFAKARLSFPDYGDQEITATVLLDTLTSESPALTAEQQNMLYAGVNEDYSHIRTKKKRYEAVREDKYFNALQLKYANAITPQMALYGSYQKHREGLSGEFQGFLFCLTTMAEALLSERQDYENN